LSPNPGPDDSPTIADPRAGTSPELSSDLDRDAFARTEVPRHEA